MTSRPLPFFLGLGFLGAIAGAWLAPLSAQPATPPPATTEQKSAAPAADPASPATPTSTPAPVPAEPAVTPPSEPSAPAAAATPAAVEQEKATTAPAKKARRSRSGPILKVQEKHGDHVRIADDHTVPKGVTVEHNMLTVLGDSTLEGTVRHDMVTVMGEALVRGTVEGKVITVMGDVTIEGRVRNDVVVIMGDLTLGENARVDGDIFSKGGKVHGDGPGKVGGEIVSIGLDEKLEFGDMTNLREWTRRGLFLGRPLAIGAHLGWLWVLTAFSLAFYFLLALAFPRGIRKCGDMLVQRPIATALSSVLGLLALPVVFVLLCVTIVGIPIAIICLPIAVVLAVLFGRAAIYALVGRAISQDRLHPALALVVGALVFVVLYLVPVLGLTLSLFVALIGFGSVLVAIFSPATPAMAGAAAATPRAPMPASTPAPTPMAATHSTSVTEPVVPIVATPVPEAPVTPTAAPVAPLAWPSEGSAFTAPPPSDVPPAPEPPPIPPPQSPGFGSAAAASAPQFSSEPPRASAHPAPAAVPAIAWETLPRAGFWLRMAALLIDLILVAMLCAPWAGPFMFILLAVYCAAMWHLRGTTIGGIVCGLKIVRLDGRELDWPVAIVRSLGCFVSLAVAGLGFIWVAFDQEKQSWHDKIAGTIVVKSPKGLSLL